jgi:lysozyme
MKTTNLIPYLLFISLSVVSCVPQDIEDESPPDECQQTQATSNPNCTTPDDDPDLGDDDDDIVEPDPTPQPDPTPRGEAFNAPWKRSDTAIVIDAYELNPINWNQMATDPRVVGVIHRSSIGMRVDRQYQARKEIAKQRGYLWGAYHLGTRDSTLAQAELFLSLIDDEEDTLMILDLEDTNNTRFMTLDQAVVFMEIIYERTGRIPVVYANHSTTRLINQRLSQNPLIQQSKLWYARFRSNVTDFPKGIWDTYFLWQFSSEVNCSRTGTCLYNVPGTLFDMDINVYNGTESQLRYEWSQL